MQARGCREGWIQAEAFQSFRSKGHSFYVNTEGISADDTRPRSLKADFASYAGDDDDAKLLFIGELKVFGVNGYYAKNLDGGAIARYLERLESAPSLNFPDDEATLVEAGVASGLLRDWGRLRTKAAPKKLLILVIDLRGTADDFGRVIQAVEFSHPAKILLKNEDVVVKAWVVSS